ncbi:MAG TPA: hypothetical protein PK812_10820 [Beijerinckiaceae bacterium]|nr:hypothetical protein [Beijerinckiaceae bacterium]
MLPRTGSPRWDAVAAAVDGPAAEGVRSHEAAADALLLRPAACHEFYAAQEADGIAGLGAILALRKTNHARSVLLWVRPATLSGEVGQVSPAGLAEYGQDPAAMVLVRVKDVRQALKAGLEGARCTALGSVLIELRGDAKSYDLTASRRLALAAKASGASVLLLRFSARPCPSAAETRWLVQAAPSRALAANAPGHPAFDLTLLRARSGRQGLCYRVEWNRNVCSFLASPRAAGDAGRSGPDTSLPGAVVPVSFSRPDRALGERRRDAG